MVLVPLCSTGLHKIRLSFGMRASTKCDITEQLTEQCINIHLILTASDIYVILTASDIYLILSASVKSVKGSQAFHVLIHFSKVIVTQLFMWIR